MSQITVSIRENTLTDKSKTHDVMVSDTYGNIIELPTISKEDAISLQSRLVLLIQAHTNETVVEI